MTKTKTKNKPSEILDNEIYQNPLSWWGDVQEKSACLARWMSLYEAINFIADKAEEKNIPFDDVELKPLDIRDYMESTQDIFLRKILEEDHKILICHNEDSTFREYSQDIDVDVEY